METFLKHTLIQILLTFELRSMLCEKNCFIRNGIKPVFKTRIGGHVFITVPVFSEFHCLDFCLRNRNCRSFNVIHKEDQRKKLCELSSIGWDEAKSGDVYKYPNANFYDIGSDEITQVS